jgi:hypothetical protein
MDFSSEMVYPLVPLFFSSVLSGLLWDRIGSSTTSWLAALLFSGFWFFPKAEK